jgi:hypothetical protein
MLWPHGVCACISPEWASDVARIHVDLPACHSVPSLCCAVSDGYAGDGTVMEIDLIKKTARLVICTLDGSLLLNGCIVLFLLIAVTLQQRSKTDMVCQ